MAEKRELTSEEVQLTRNNILSQEKQVKILEYNKKELSLKIEGFPFIKDAYEEKLKECDRELSISLQAIKDGKKLLERVK